ncbi:hypothetical protein AALO_G00021720 [Alosa alosa]|uniref:Ubiquitin-like domain-containing protein n=1 Tax=Alosa alosa TaxID=278164 RepID=A0AAV6H9B1_9TELE|nr:hypothetical protein AALO_G00021720 [Alosa alosa]
MATLTCAPQNLWTFQPSVHQACNPACTPTALPSPVEHHPALKHTTHAYLGVIRESSSSPGPFTVTVMNGSNGKAVHLVVKSTDTIVQLQTQLNRKGGPEWKDMNLAFNGKPVMEDKYLRDLGVREGSMFVTYRRCPGG